MSQPFSNPGVPFLASRAINLACLVAAFAVTLLWFVVYAPLAGGGICDEPGHWGVIERLLADWRDWPDSLPHPPGYHYVVIWLSAGSPTPMSARAVTSLFALLGLVCFAAAWQLQHQRPPGPAVLLFALLPILQPFTAMIYTDVPALALLLAAWWAQLGRRAWLAGLLLAAACSVRQTSVIWGTFFLVHEAGRAWPAHGTWRERCAATARGVWLNGWGILLVLALVAGVVLVTGRLTPGTEHGNALAANPANLYFGAVLVFFLGLPLWLRAGPDFFRGLAVSARTRPAASGLGLIAVSGVVIALSLGYRNPHVWNRELWWPDTSFTLLRNWPLVAADRIVGLRWVYSILVVLMAAGLVAVAREQRFRRELALTALFGSVLLATNGLVEPRYFITPVVFWLFFHEFDRRSLQLLTGWFAVICAVHAPFIARTLSLW
ncbi:MAG: hypothetical protein Q8J74_07500 [Candidatus Didemnitutus sp.]|nr:hypothetical protein [Candidatus Didemnitutus sp.]